MAIGIINLSKAFQIFHLPFTVYIRSQPSLSSSIFEEILIIIRSGKMVLLDKMWDDVVAGPPPERGLGKLRKISTRPLSIKDIDQGEGSSVKQFQRTMSMPGSSPGTPTTPVTPTTPASARNNVWRSVFHPGSNLATRTIGAQVFDKPQANTPTVYDWMYSGESRSQHR